MRDFFAENSLAPLHMTGEGYEDWSADGIRLRCGDFFDLRPQDLAGVGGVYDRASLIALPPESRPAYAAHLKRLLPTGVPMLLVTLEYDQSAMSGPPFAVHDAEVRTVYGEGFDVELIYERDVLAENAKFRARGLSSLVEKVYLLRARPLDSTSSSPHGGPRSDPLSAAFDRQVDVEVSGRDVLHQGFLRLSRYRLRHRRHDGGWSAPLVRERVEGLRAASVLLYDPARDAVVLIEQFRIGALDGRAWVVETVGGYVPPDESPEAVARREVREETGCEVGRLEPICHFWVSPGYSSERIHLFCGEVDSRGAGGIHGLPEEGEDILVRVVPADEAIAALDTGDGSGWADSTSLVIALHWLALNREALKGRWLGA